MTQFQQLTAARREQRRYEKRLRDQAIAVYRRQVEAYQQQTAMLLVAAESGAAVFGELAASAIDGINRLKH